MFETATVDIGYRIVNELTNKKQFFNNPEKYNELLENKKSDEA